MSSLDAPAPSRERQTLNGAILASGVDQAIQFVLPLFAGAVLGLPPWQTGMLVAANALATFTIRPFAGEASSPAQVRGCSRSGADSTPWQRACRWR